ncbi:MAG TPA: hypothetical protein VEF34_04750 [Syntrophobacteraceae bacterium]|nr:hypothetical protein [Syntrophobacteraceae bacterium]
MLGRKKELTVLDVRRKADFEADGHVIPGASYKDPNGIGSDPVSQAERGQVSV